MAELFSFCWKSIFSKASCGSEDIIQNIPLESKLVIDYCFRRVKAVSQEAFFLANGRCLNFFFKLLLHFSLVFCKLKENNFFQQSSSGSLDNTFLRKPCKFEQNRSSDTREILTTVFKM